MTKLRIRLIIPNAKEIRLIVAFLLANFPGLSYRSTLTEISHEKSFHCSRNYFTEQLFQHGHKRYERYQ
jgi:hypothetical protein